MAEASMKCANCGKTNLHGGTARGLGTYQFIPGGVLRMWGYPLEAFVCLDCGFLNLYISGNKLEGLRSILHKETHAKEEPAK